MSLAGIERHAHILVRTVLQDVHLCAILRAPRTRCTDAQQQLHCESGPAVTFADGYAFFLARQEAIMIVHFVNSRISLVYYQEYLSPRSGCLDFQLRRRIQTKASSFVTEFARTCAYGSKAPKRTSRWSDCPKCGGHGFTNVRVGLYPPILQNIASAARSTSHGRKR